MNRFLKGTLFILVLLVGTAAIAVYWTFYRPLPTYDTTLNLTGLEQSVDIHWDSFGIPHIYASTKPDLYRAVGYVHAQDRLWQMTLSQLVAEGRLAEFFGKELLPYDKLQRTIGFWRIARQLEAELPDSTRAHLQAYADGVNAYVEQNPRSLPIEFSLADMRPLKWTVTHTIALARLMAWELNIPWRAELSYSFIHQKLGGRLFRQLFPNEKLYAGSKPALDTRNHPNYLGALMPLMKYRRGLSRILQMQGSLRGSNAWAVDGSKTATGYPMLAGDPHLGLSIPGKWYEVHLNLNEKNLSGATIAGAPAIILGQNDHLAWTFTNVTLDDTDFFAEAINPDNPSQYVLDTLAGEPLYEEFTIQREVIKIKDEDDTTFSRRLTKHGPVISDVVPDQHLVDDRVITMQWTGYELTNESTVLESMGWATSLEEFEQAVEKFRVPAQNVIYADRYGNIAQFTAANVPIRTANPVLVREGWQPEQDWQGYIPYENLPRTVNPNQGWVANANNALVDDSFPYYMTDYWYAGYRYQRIRQYLSGSDPITKQVFQVMQNDTYSVFAEQMTGFILPVLENNITEDTNFKTVISYLRNWDYTYGPSETAASIMDAFIMHLSRNVLQDEMGAETYNAFIEFSAQPVRILVRFIQDGSPFFDNVNTEQRETMEEQVILSMKQALDWLIEHRGSEPIEWRWELLHTLTLKAPLFSEAAGSEDAPKALQLVTNNILEKGPFPVGGHAQSLNNGEYLWTDPFDMVLGPSIRRIIDFSDLGTTLSIMPTGQSGNPISQFYGDQTESWLNGEYKFFYQDSTLFNETELQTMKLVPAN